jgi:hypothetical protein
MEPALVHSPRYHFVLPEVGPDEDLASLHLFVGRRAGRLRALEFLAKPMIEVRERGMQP